MAEYLISLVSVTALSALAGLFSYGTGDKWHKFAVSVIVLYISLVPLADLADGLGKLELPDFSSSGELPDAGAFEKTAEEAFMLGIKRLIAEKWDIPEEKITVSVRDFEIEKMKAGYITVTLSGQGMSADYKKIEKHIEKSGLGECEVRYAFE